MSSIERKIVSLGIFAMFGYLVLYQFFFTPAFNGNEPYSSESTIDLLGWATAVLVFVCIFLLLRDLKHRDVSGKAGWVVGIFFSPGSAYHTISLSTRGGLSPMPHNKCGQFAPFGRRTRL